MENTKDRILDHLPLVSIVAGRLHRLHGLPRKIHEDLKQEGYIGLIDADKRYDPNRGASFKTFAWIVVQGRMLDYVRRECRHLIVHDEFGHRHTMSPVEDAVIAREQLSTAMEIVRQLPHRRRHVMTAVINLQPIRQAAADMVVPIRKALRWRRQVLAEVAAMAA
jgi:RNA polymerase sigma factor (sigma-70 family)